MKKQNRKPFDGEIPVGFGMSLAMNGDAMSKFSELNADEQKNLINRAKNVKSKQEMTGLTDDIKSNGEQIL